jgi:PAS domain S-box-containing protein
MDEIKKTRVCTTYEKVFIHKDGHRLNVLIGGAMIGDASDQGVAFIVDLTERQRLEEETHGLLATIQAEKDRLSALINSMNDEVWLADREGRFSLANPSGLHEFGIAVNDAIDVEKMAASLEVYRPDGTPRPIEETPPLRALKGEVVRNQEEIIRTPASDELRYREVNAAPVRDAEGNIIGSVSVVRDITERKRAEEQLRRNQKTFTELVERSPFGTYVVDSQFRIAIMNASSQEGAFCNVRPVIGRPFDEAMRTLWPEPVAAEIIGHFRHTLETGEPYYSPSFINPRHDKEIIESYEWELHRMTLLDGQNGVICYYFDSTKLQEAQAALKEAKESLELRVQERTIDLQNLTEQLEKSRHELRKLASELVVSEERERKRVAGVLHDDIAQILAAARMRLDLLQSTPSDQKDKQTLQEVKSFLVQSIQETRALMNDLGNPVLFDLGLKAACEALAKRLMERHPVRISCEIPDAYKDLDPDVKTIVFQVVRELLNNIAKHSQAQNARVMIDMEDGHFRVRVTDDGVGFDSRTLGTPADEGGFGLYSIRERLIAMNGSLKIESASGAGTAVTAFLPVALD